MAITIKCDCGFETIFETDIIPKQHICYKCKKSLNLKDIQNKPVKIKIKRN